MDLYEETAHSFILKIWLEERVAVRKSAVWRGHVTHVPSGKRRYIQSLGELSNFVRPYLQEMGVEIEPSEGDPDR